MQANEVMLKRALYVQETKVASMEDVHSKLTQEITEQAHDKGGGHAHISSNNRRAPPAQISTCSCFVFDFCFQLICQCMHFILLGMNFCRPDHSWPAEASSISDFQNPYEYSFMFHGVFRALPLARHAPPCRSFHAPCRPVPTSESLQDFLHNSWDFPRAALEQGRHLLLVFLCSVQTCARIQKHNAHNIYKVVCCSTSGTLPAVNEHERRKTYHTHGGQVD